MDLKTLENTPAWEWPEDADKVFLGFLRDKQGDLSERLLAAELAGDYTTINDELAEALLAILSSNDEPEPLRKKAADILLKLIESPDQDIVDAAYEAMGMAEGLADLSQDMDDDDFPF